MAREYDLYLQLHELQPPHLSYQDHYHLPHHGPSASAVPPFELTAGPGGGGDGGGADGPTLHPLEHRKRKPSHGGGEGARLLDDHGPSLARKRKPSYSSAGGTYDDCDDDSHSTRTMPDKKQNHSEIEKRRRDKMNTYIAELSGMVPMCRAMARKLDKLTVLRLAVGHVRAVRGALNACPLTAPPRPAFLSQREVNALVLRAAHDAFLLVVGCDRGRLLYVSASVAGLLHYDQSELLGQSLFDLLHPKDVAKVKEQLSSPDLSPRERLIDAKTMLPVKTDVVSGASRLCPGARRSFFCRVKCRPSPAAAAPAVAVKQEGDVSAPASATSAPANKLRKKQTPEKKYCVVQCTGYLKSWTGSEAAGCEEGGDGGGGSGGDESGDDSGSASCLVAVARALPGVAAAEDASTGRAAGALPAQPPPTRRLQYVSRHTPDGKFLFVDQRVTLALGFLPQELLGTSLYEYVGSAELAGVARAHKAALQRAPTRTPPYSFRRKDGSYAQVHTHFKHFHNPWTKDVECLVANNTLVTGDGGGDDDDDARDRPPYDVYKGGGGGEGCEGGGEGAAEEGDAEVQRLIDSQVESHKIGSAIAEEALRHASPAFSPDLAADLAVDLAADLLHDAAFSQHASLVDSILGAAGAAPPSASPPPHHVRNNVALSSAAPGSPGSPPGGGGGSSPGGGGGGGGDADGSPPLPPLALDGNGEAAMAVIMNLLEADAGLGGPVNLAGLPWLLP